MIRIFISALVILFSLPSRSDSNVLSNAVLRCDIYRSSMLQGQVATTELISTYQKPVMQIGELAEMDLNLPSPYEGVRLHFETQRDNSRIIQNSDSYIESYFSNSVAGEPQRDRSVDILGHSQKAYFNPQSSPRGSKIILRGSIIATQTITYECAIEF